MSIIEHMTNKKRPQAPDKHAVVYLDDSGYWNVGFVADYDNAKDTARRWKERLTECSHSGKIMICKLVETIEWRNR